MHPIFTEVSQTVSRLWEIYTFMLKKPRRYQGVIHAKMDSGILILSFQGLWMQILELEKTID